MKKKLRDSFGNVTEISIDREDAHLFNTYRAVPKYEYSRDVPSYVVFTNLVPGEQVYAARAIMNDHGLLPPGKNVKFRDGNTYNLQKKNLYVGRKEKGKN